MSTIVIVVPCGEGGEFRRKRFTGECKRGKITRKIFTFTGESEAVNRGIFLPFTRLSDQCAVKVNAYIYLKIYRLNLHRSPEVSGGVGLVLRNSTSTPRRSKGGSL